MKRLARWVLAPAAAVAGAYAGMAAAAWWRYGAARAPRGDAADTQLDRFMPWFDVAERHHIAVEAPPEITLQAACEADLMQSRLTRAIFSAREVVLRSLPVQHDLPRGLLALAKSIGWGVLAEVPGREVVMGAVTQPWQADVVFRPIPPEQFQSFNEPGFVKIVWTLRADPLGESRSIFRTETRAVATDSAARRKFRRYWALASPGIVLIRWLSLSPVKCEAERRVRAA